MPNTIQKILATLMAFLTIHSDLHAGTISVLSAPVEMAGNVYPNLILGVDDSGSMDFEVMMNTIDGELWWDATNKRFADASGMRDDGPVDGLGRRRLRSGSIQRGDG